MNKSLFILFVFAAAIFSSCSFNGTLQGLFSYYNKTKQDSEINFVEFSSFEDCKKLLSDSASILVANGKEIKNCLSKYQNSVVYIWTPKCKGKYCYSLNLLQETCNQKGYELFIVAEYFDAYYMSKYYEITHPIIGIDVKFYKTNLTSKYLSKFIFELTDGKYKYDIKNDSYCNFLCFANGELKKTIMSIEEL